MKKSGTFVAQYGYSLGSIIAVTVSWSLNHSIIWAILHGLFGWFYVIYYLIFK
jgi:hypothetical protein